VRRVVSGEVPGFESRPRRPADACERIAKDDEMMKRCVQTCRTCAESCERMARAKAAYVGESRTRSARMNPLAVVQL
jgi:hypothetical protein